jgi:hypothetical protein
VGVAYLERLQRHLCRFWPDHRCEPLMWTLGSWPREHPEFRVLELAPPGRDQHWIYVSAGAAQLRRSGGVGHEYVIRTRQQERLMAELLAMVASYCEREDDDGLHDGHTGRSPSPAGRAEPILAGSTEGRPRLTEPWFC